MVFNVHPGVFVKLAGENLRGSSPLRGTALEHFNYFSVKDKINLNLAALRSHSTQLGVCPQGSRGAKISQPRV